jgi:hypothetical protein
MKPAKAKKPAPARKRQHPRPRQPLPQRKRPHRKSQNPEPSLPAILFEGDRPGLSAEGPGQRLAPPSGAPGDNPTAPAALPQAYGTRQVLVTARDPHWLYVHWDLTLDQLRQYNALSLHKHLVLRIAKAGANEPAGEVHVHPESRHWFVHVAEAGARYTVELGYHDRAKAWIRIALSAPTTTPPNVVSDDTSAKFATIPADVTLSRLQELVRTGAGSQPSLAYALEALRRAGHPELPAVPDPAKPWTPEQEHALAAVLLGKDPGRGAVSSLDIAELVRQGLPENISSLLMALAAPAGISSPSSPHGGAPAGSAGFWFNLNVELTIYGATEPNASVTIGGRPVKLRPDGSFSHRFALPDGQYELPVTAVSADATEARHADLKLSRATDYVGDVGQQPQDPALHPPPTDAG